MNKGKFKMLIRNLRTNKYEKISFRGNTSDVLQGEKSNKSTIQPKKNNN